MVDQTQPEILEIHTKNRAKKYNDDKLKRYEATINMVIMWLDSNIDDNGPNSELAQDSADLKQKIELALDSSTSILDIKNGDL